MKFPFKKPSTFFSLPTPSSPVFLNATKATRNHSGTRIEFVEENNFDPPLRFFTFSFDSDVEAKPHRFTSSILSPALNINHASAEPTDHESQLKYKAVTPALSFKIFSQLSKGRLAALVALTSMAGCAMAPVPCDPYVLLFTSVGTALCITSANTFNQWMEKPFDAQMTRTRNRPLVGFCLLLLRYSSPPLCFVFCFLALIFFTVLSFSNMTNLCILLHQASISFSRTHRHQVRLKISALQAVTIGVACGTFGGSILYQVSPLASLLGISNILLYSLVYTPLKRLHPVNTWIGSLVGAIPPLIGYCAVTGSLDATACLLGLHLFIWQFPHFNSLAFLIREEYAMAGYRMLACTHPRLNSLIAFRLIPTSQ